MKKEFDNYKKGDWNVICDVCGCKMKHSESRKRWDGMLVCGEDWERRHPNDFAPPRFPGEGRGLRGTLSRRDGTAGLSLAGRFHGGGAALLRGTGCRDGGGDRVSPEWRLRAWVSRGHCWSRGAAGAIVALALKWRTA